MKLKGGSMKNFLTQAVSKFIQRRKGKDTHPFSIPEKAWMVDLKRDAENAAFLSLRNHSKRF